MADTSNLSKFLSDVADAIRTKKDVIDPIPAANFDTEILSIDVGTDTSDADAVAENIEKGKTAYVNGEKITGTLEDAGSSADVMVAADNIKVGNERGWDCVSTTYTNTDKKIHRDGWYVDQHIKFEDLAPRLGVTPDKIVSGNSILGVEGTYEGGGSGEGTEDATATADDVLSPKTFYAKGIKQKGSIQYTSSNISGSVSPHLFDNDINMKLQCISEKYKLAIYCNNGSSNIYFYRYENNTITTLLKTVSSTSLDSNITSILKIYFTDVTNGNGNLMLWLMTSAYQYGVCEMTTDGEILFDTFRYFTDSTTSPGFGFAINPKYPDTIAYAYYGTYAGSGAYYRLRVRRFNTTTQSFNAQLGFNYEGFSSRYGTGKCEWDSTGTYVMITGGTWTNNFVSIGKYNYNQYSVSSVRNGLHSASQICLINDTYCIRNNALCTISGFTVKKTYSELLVTDNTHIWCVDNILFLLDNGGNKLYVYKLDLSTFELTSLFNVSADYYWSSTTGTDVGTPYWPLSHMHQVCMTALSIGYTFTFGEFEKIISAEIKGNKLLNVSGGTITPETILAGKIGYKESGEVVGTMPNNGVLQYTPSVESQTIPAGYTSGGTISGVTSEIDDNITADNIKQGVSILGVEGTYAPTGGDATSDAEIQAKYLLEGYSAVSDGKWVEGTMVNYGTVDMIWSSKVQEIPTGYYDELYIPRAVASNLDGYDECSDALSVVMYGQNWKYTELNYIESTGNQFIDINYIPKTLHTKYEVGFMRLSVNSYWNPIINNEEDVRFGIMCTKDTNDGNDINNGQFHIGASNNMQAVTFPVENNIKYDIVADKTGISLNGTKYEIEGEVADATGTWSACINHRYISATEFSPEHSIGRWYYLKVYEDNVLVKNLVPAIETATNKVCMYDTIGRVFHHNIGEGNFISGGVKE